MEGKEMLKTKRSVLLVISLVISLFITVFLYIYDQLQPLEPHADEEKLIRIPSGSNSKEVAQLLEDKQLIKNAFIFQLYLTWMGYDDEIQAGHYKLSKQMGTLEIAKKLISGDVTHETIRFTIPEGLNIEQIADRLEAEGLINKETFLQLAKEGNFDYVFIKQIPADQRLIYRLEGYLYPDTYEINQHASEKEIINKMLAQFQAHWQEAWNQILEQRKITLHDLITIASIVEREVMLDQERPMVAGVIYNRLKSGWKLQIDATIQYVLKKHKDRLLYKDLKIEHPYNTYLHVGLPPGPISNPGIESIKAALFPDENDYFFYVTKKDHSGEHYFSKTYQEHLKMDAKSRGIQ